MTSEDLKRLLANPLYYVNGNVLDADKCRQLAETLMKRFWIKKGDRHYWIKDIEFTVESILPSEAGRTMPSTLVANDGSRVLLRIPCLAGF